APPPARRPPTPRPAQTVIGARPARAVGGPVLGETPRPAPPPTPATAGGAADPDRAACIAGHGVLLLAIPSWQHPSPACADSSLLVAQEWVQRLRQTLAGCRWLLPPGAPVVSVTRPTRHHGQLLDLPGAVIDAGRAAGLVPIQRCAAVTVSARGTGVPIRPGWVECLHGAGQQRRLAGRLGESGAAGVGRIRWLTRYPISRVAHHDIVVFRTPPALTETAALASAYPPARPPRISGNPFEPSILERPAA